MESKLTTDNCLLLDGYVLKTPFELLRRSFKTSQRNVEKDYGFLLQLIQQLRQVTKEDSSSLAEVKEDLVVKLETGIERAKGLKRKLADLLPSPSNPTLLRPRLDHISKVETFASPNEDQFKIWDDQRYMRYVIDYLLRTGKLESARELAKSTHLEALVDLDLFQELAHVDQALQSRSCSEALVWAGENRGALKRANNPLESSLRLQEYIELCRKRDLVQALAYYRKYLSIWYETPEVRRAAGLLAFDEQIARKVGMYASMYHISRWDTLRDKFRSTFIDVYALPAVSPFITSLLAGLAAFKLPACSPDIPYLLLPASTKPPFGSLPTSTTDSSSVGDQGGGRARYQIELGQTLTFNPWPSSGEPSSGLPSSYNLPALGPPTGLPSSHLSTSISGPATLSFSSSLSPFSDFTATGGLTTILDHPVGRAGNPSCPTCDSHLGAIAKDLPGSHNENSVLVCRISGRVMDGSAEGSPVTFPNGYVYSFGAMQEMANKNNGIVTCPRSGYSCSISELKKVFVL
ncbi:Uncharacterized conserved protein [Phaffia rhodozyma]|uniref:Uncharacterized conserved protein n=1 Tax=Phaffia rhodozyma TaxID=264483 RepID=A0A0F7SEN5_PHARH|nr:Uncharacterized conserved protein [Phaffia rhodozyma]